MVDATVEEFEVIELFSKLALFTNARVNRESVPDGMHCYDIRYGDNGDLPGTMENSVSVNHMGTVICDTNFNVEIGSYIPITEDDLSFEGYTESLDEYVKMQELSGVYIPNAD